MVQKLGWKPLEDRRTRARLTTIYKETHGLIPNNIDSPTKAATKLAAYMESSRMRHLNLVKTV